MSLAWTTADSQNDCSMQSSQLENGTKAGRGSGTKMCWNRPSRPTTFQLTSGKPWPKTGQPGGQQYARAQSTLRKADYRAWMIRDRQGRTECQTLALLYLVSSAARSALPLSGSKLICTNTSTDASSSKSKDYYYYSWVLYHLCDSTSIFGRPYSMLLYCGIDRVILGKVITMYCSQVLYDMISWIYEWYGKWHYR